jgi:OOP family OmpA-OmpF porin
MKLPVLFFYGACFFVLVACGANKNSTKSSDLASSSGMPSLGDDDYDGVPNSVDECRYIFGPMRTGGCPDADADGIADKDDRCPDLKGFANLSGCIDRDYDGIIDPDDNCPDAYGEGLMGCPEANENDRDGDGVVNDEDQCPDLRGLFTANGCPDADGDGIPNSEDACPRYFGVEAYAGCPIDKEELDALLVKYGGGSKDEAILNRGYYKGKDGRLYDRNDKVISVVAGEIVDEKGNVLTQNGNFQVDIQGQIIDSDGTVVRIDDMGYLLGANNEPIVAKQLNASGNGIKFGDVVSLKYGDPTGGAASSSGAYITPSEELTPEQKAACERIDLKSLRAAIYFAHNASGFEADSEVQLNKVVDAMRRCIALELQVAGHSDSDGQTEYNKSLSERRAKSVLDYVMGRGINNKRLKYNAYGEEYPIASNDTEEGKQQNRRAEVDVNFR